MMLASVERDDGAAAQVEKAACKSGRKAMDGRKGRSGRVKGGAAGGVVEWTSLGLVVVSFPNLIPLNETALLLAAGC